jgi:hypothetical protein
MRPCTGVPAKWPTRRFGRHRYDKKQTDRRHGSQDLKQRYSVTTQHTFVQIDESGDEKTRFTGSITGADIQSNLV